MLHIDFGPYYVKTVLYVTTIFIIWCTLIQTHRKDTIELITYMLNLIRLYLFQ